MHAAVLFILEYIASSAPGPIADQAAQFHGKVADELRAVKEFMASVPASVEGQSAVNSFPVNFPEGAESGDINNNQ